MTKVSRTNDADIYCQPIVFLKLMQDAKKELGTAAIDGNQYKALRETWVAANFLIAATNVSKEVWWIRPNPRDEAPDCFAFTAVFDDGMWGGANIEIEVFEWHENSKFGLLETIKNKLKNVVSKNLILICYSRKLIDPNIIPVVSKELIKIGPLVSEIIILADFPIGRQVVKIFPELGRLPVPNRVPLEYLELPFMFASKMRKILKGSSPWVGDAGLYQVDFKLNFTKLPE